ncbi:MAG TPA: hypothetical protein VNH19_05575 [Candidatus Limnocylindrales bacterium]|nr:hypothetical protein [Candidatus Limnocylindrales bacterium]
MTHASSYATSLANAVALLIDSEKFRAWRPFKPNRAMLMGEKHWTPQELAKIWGVSVQTIRDIFQREEGVLKIGRDGTRSRRRYKTLRIPESVAERVHTRLSA